MKVDGKKIWKIARGVLLFVVTALVILFLTFYIMLQKCCSDKSPAAKTLFVTTILETGQMKFLASWVCSDKEIEQIVNSNKMEDMDTDIDSSMITIGEDDDKKTSTNEYPDEEYDENGICIKEISGRSFFAKMMIVKDPSQVITGTTAPWSEYGKELDIIVSDFGAVAGVNGGLYESAGNKGGKPLGVVVQGGDITFNQPSALEGLYMIGFNESNILLIKDLSGMSPNDFEEYVKEEKVRDAVAFQEESTDKNNHFVPLIINGEARKMDGQGSGANPRTAIGQRKDGSILLLVTDGRGASGHLGATASDLIGIMSQYGAVNAANIDGGSSASMVYNGNYEMSSVTFYYENSSWKLPTAFVVKAKDK